MCVCRQAHPKTSARPDFFGANSRLEFSRGVLSCRCYMYVCICEYMYIVMYTYVNIYIYVCKHICLICRSLLFSRRTSFLQVRCDMYVYVNTFTYICIYLFLICALFVGLFCQECRSLWPHVRVSFVICVGLFCHMTGI